MTLRVGPKALVRRALALTAGAFAVVSSVALILGFVVFSVPRYSGKPSDHFDGTRFFNLDRESKGFADVLKWLFTGERAKWPSEVAVAPRLKVSSPPPGQVQVTFVGHSTFLIQMDGLNILTDPIWSERCSPLSWIGPKRVREPGLPFASLPKIDLVLLSHNHYDHLDLPTLRRLSKRDVPRILTGLGNGSWLESAGVSNAEDLDWWDSRDVGDVKITFTPARHFSGRGLVDRNGTLWGSFMVEGPTGRVYFAGDTGYGEHFTETRQRLGAPDLALIPIGAYEPRWFMARAHVNPAEAVRAHLDLGARRSIGMHFGTFQLTDEAIDAPQEALALALAEAGLAEEDFLVPEFGGLYLFSPSSG